MNIIAQLEFELTYYDIAVQHISHYNTGITCTLKLGDLIKKFSIFF